MLITQTHSAANIDMAAWLAGIGSYVGGTSTDLVFLNADGTYTHVMGTGLSFNASPQTWSGSVTHLILAMNATPDSWAMMAVTSWITYSVAQTVVDRAVSQTPTLFQQLMNVPGNTNAGTGTWGNEVFAGSDQQDSFDGEGGIDVVDYRFATWGLSVDLSGATMALGSAADDVLLNIEGIRGTRFGDTLRGNSLRNLLDGAGGDDVIHASGGVDTLVGGAGWDWVILSGLSGDLTVGSTVSGSSLSEFEGFVTGAGNDMIYASGGAQYETNAGNDTLSVSGAEHRVIRTGSGDDRIEIYSHLSMNLDFGTEFDRLVFVLSSAGVLNVTMTGQGAGTLSGTHSGTFTGLEYLQSLNLALNYAGHAGRDEVLGSIGNDTLVGASGDDYFLAGNGNDLLWGDSDWGFQGGSSDYGSDSIGAGGGNDTMHAGGGNDTYSGGSERDVLSYRQLFDDYGNGEYFITLNSNNTVTKSFMDWYGDVYSETDTILVGTGDDIEEIVGTVSGDTFYNNLGSARSYRGDAGADMFWFWAATTGETVLDLGNGADVLRVRAATPVTAWLAGNWTATAQSDMIVSVTFETQGWNIDLSQMSAYAGATLRNTSATDGAVMVGTAFADRFESASALDQMHGGEGGDTYVVTAATSFPLIFEEYGASGRDLIMTSATGLDIGDTIEDVTLLDGAISVWGNYLANYITGNDAANIIRGEGGDDTLEGGKGSDTYYIKGNDTLIESPYFISYYDIDFGWVTDPYRDLVIVTESYVLTSSGLEDLRLDTGALNGTGNLQGNTITGNAAANGLRGLAGHDTLQGGAGNDTLWGGTENDRLRGDGGADSLRGEAGNDVLLGGDGADHLTGGAGVNRLTGGAGRDQFLFGRQIETTTITDFADGQDKLAFLPGVGKSEAFLLGQAVQDGTDVVLTTTIAGMQIRVLDTTIAALAGDILIL